MSVFISHSFENKPEFENVADALEQAGILYWNPGDVKVGGSLRDELRRAVDKCDVCIFVATHGAVKSSWCGAELGAFWGSGKPIIVYIADSSLTKDDLPEIVRGDVWERKIKKVVERAGELVNEAASAAAEAKSDTSKYVGNMTVAQLERVIRGAMSLTAASTKASGADATAEDIGRAVKGAADSVVEGIKAAKFGGPNSTDDWRNHILWVDDLPDNNHYERQAFESLGFRFTLALSTKEALGFLAKEQFGAIISDMGRVEGPQEGYVLLDAVRAKGLQTPFFIYAGSNSPAHKAQTRKRGGQDCTNNPIELLEMVTGALKSPPSSRKAE